MLITQLEINTKWGEMKHTGRERPALKKKKSIFFEKYKTKRPRKKGWQTLKQDATKKILGRNHQGINEVVDSSGKQILARWVTIGDSSRLGGICSVPQ